MTFNKNEVIGASIFSFGAGATVVLIVNYLTKMKYSELPSLEFRLTITIAAMVLGFILMVINHESN